MADPKDNPEIQAGGVALLFLTCNFHLRYAFCFHLSEPRQGKREIDDNILSF